MGKKSYGLIVLMLLAILVTGLSSFGCSSSSTETTSPATTAAPTSEPEKVYEISYSIFLPPAAAIAQMCVQFADAIETNSGGRIEITLHEGGSLLSAPAVYQGVLDGIADMGLGISSYNPGNFPFTSIAELPGAGQSGWAVSNAMGDFLEKYKPAEWEGVQVLSVTGTGADLTTVDTVKEPILVLEDFQGKSIRFNHADVVTALGGSLKDVPMSDVFDALSKGVLDGMIGQAEMLKSWKMGDVAKYNTIITAPVQPSIMWYNVMNKKTFDGLPADLQKIVLDTGKEFNGKFGLIWDDGAVGAIEYVVSIGNTINVISDAEAARWVDAINPIIEERLQALTEKGFTRAEIDDAWAYFQERVDYWNGQQAANGVSPALDRMLDIIE